MAVINFLVVPTVLHSHEKLTPPNPWEVVIVIEYPLFWLRCSVYHPYIMSARRGLLLSTLYVLLRLSPALTSLAILENRFASLDEVEFVANRFLRLFLVLVTWSMAEGACMLWIRARKESSPQSLGYAITASVFGLITAFFLGLFRSQSPETTFLLLLGSLGLRGATRSGWEQGRPQISIVTSVLAHTSMAALSFMVVLNDSLPWQAAILCAAVGSLVGAVEVSWNSETLASLRAKWILIVFRVLLVLPPIAVGLLALLGYLSHIYLSTYLILVPLARVNKRCSVENRVTPELFPSTAGLYLLFVTIMVACRVFS